jgi:hypothetical protein
MAMVYSGNEWNVPDPECFDYPHSGFWANLLSLTRITEREAGQDAISLHTISANG